MRTLKQNGIQVRLLHEFTGRASWKTTTRRAPAGSEQCALLPVCGMAEGIFASTHWPSMPAERI